MVLALSCKENPASTPSLRKWVLRFRQGKQQLKGALLKNLLVYSRRFIPQSVKRRLGRIFPQVHQQAVREAQFSGIDWSQTQVFTDLFGVQVYINLKGRQPEGIVCPEEYDPLREQIMKLLLNLKMKRRGTRHQIRASFERILSWPLCGKGWRPVDSMGLWESRGFPLLSNERGETKFDVGQRIFTSIGDGLVITVLKGSSWQWALISNEE